MALVRRTRKPVIISLLLLLVVSIMLPGPTALSAPGAPLRISPADGSVTDSVSAPPYGVPTFQWEAVSGATKYQIQVSSTIGFNQGTIRVDIATPNTNYTPTSNQYLINGTFYWRVRASDGVTWGDYNAQPWSFTKSWMGAPALQEPENGASIQSFAYPVFTWTPVIGASRYKFELSGDPSFGTPVTGYPVYAYVPTLTPTAKLGNGTYYWRVTPLDRYGNSGEASITRSFTLSWTQAPTCH